MMARHMTTLPFRFHISGLLLAALMIGAGITPAPAQTAVAAPADRTDQQAPKRKKMVERAAAVMKALGDASAKRGQKLPALADYYAAKADLKGFVDYVAKLYGTDHMVWGSDLGNTPGTMDEHFALLQRHCGFGCPGGDGKRTGSQRGGQQGQMSHTAFSRIWIADFLLSTNLWIPTY